MPGQQYDIGGQILEYSDSTGGLVPVKGISSTSGNLGRILGNLGARLAKAKRRRVKKVNPPSVTTVEAARRILRPENVRKLRALYECARRGNKRCIKAVALIRKVELQSKKPAARLMAKAAMTVMRSQHSGGGGGGGGDGGPPPASIPAEQSEAVERGEESAFIPASDAAPTSDEASQMEPTTEIESEQQADAEASDAADEIEEMPESQIDEEASAATVGMVLGLSLGIKKLGRLAKRAGGGLARTTIRVGKVAVPALGPFATLAPMFPALAPAMLAAQVALKTDGMRKALSLYARAKAGDALALKKVAAIRKIAESPIAHVAKGRAKAALLVMRAQRRIDLGDMENTD